SQAYEELYGSGHALDSLSIAMKKIEQIADFDKVIPPILEQIQNAYYQLEDTAHLLRDYRDHVEFNPQRLEEIEERLNTISTLKRKYGKAVDEVLQYFDQITHELNTLQNM